MKRSTIIASACILMASSASAAPKINEDYIKSLAAPGKTVLVIEYYDGNDHVVERKGFASKEGYKAISPTDFRVDADTTIHLYGLEPCNGEMVNRAENFSGSCSDFAKQQLQIMLQSPKVIYCRAFISEASAANQDATCYGYYNYPGSLDTIDMFEEQLVSLGALRVARGPDGQPLRTDLDEAEKIGRQGYGMWADPRLSGQDE
jgi:hypothetical protein